MTQSQPRVLVVDIAPLVQQQAAEGLAEHGFVCETAGNGGQAMDMLDAEPFDVVVSDLRMSLGRGRSFCLDLLQSGDRPPTIIITEEVAPHIVQSLKSRGAADVCFKPLDYTALASKIKEVVESASAKTAKAADAAPATDVDTSQSKRIVTILMQDAERRAELVEKLAAVDVEGVAVSGSEDLNRQLNQQRVDLVLIENDLGGFLTGLEILKRLADDLIRPEAILLAESTEQVKRQVEAAGIKTVLDPETDLDDIVKTVTGLSTDVSARSEIIPMAARKLVQEFEGIPPLPQLVLKLTGYMAMDVADIPVKELANDISFDPKAIGDLLKLTNSASMGMPRKITKVSEAVNLLGPKRTISLILATATFSAQAQLLKNWSEDLRNWYYKRSVLIANTAATFAEKMEKVSPDTAFILGLLQDVGMLVLANSYGERYSILIGRVREVGQLKFHQLEEKDYKVTHPSVSAALLQKWKFPQSLIGPVLDHHSHVNSDERSKVECSLMHAMQIGEALADLADLPHPVRRQVLNQLLSKYGDEMAMPCQKCLADSINKSAESFKLFSLPAPDPQEMQRLVDTVTSNEAEPVGAAVG